MAMRFGAKIIIGRKIMLVKTEWYTPQRIIHQVYSGDISFADMQTGHQVVLRLIDEAHHNKDRIHIIINMTARESLSPDLMNLNTLRRLFRFDAYSDLVGWILIIQSQPNPIMHFFSLAAAKVTGFRLRMMPNLDDAHTFLKRADTSLPDSFLPS